MFKKLWMSGVLGMALGGGRFIGHSVDRPIVRRKSVRNESYAGVARADKPPTRTRECARRRRQMASGVLKAESCGVSAV